MVGYGGNSLVGFSGVFFPAGAVEDEKGQG